MSRYFSKFRSSAKYFRFKHGIKKTFSHIPLIGGGLIKISRKIKNSIKKKLLSQNYFEQFGLSYYGPLNGNDEKHLEEVLREAKNDGACSVIHICTTKGKGYAPAELHPDKFHGVSGFDVATGEIKSSGRESFSERFGKLLTDRAEKNGKIVAITAAMPDGTGLTGFKERFPDRFFDVGIAEEHAVTFACGLAAQGMVPVFAVYSTFMQRGYDQLLHDCALQNLHVVFMLDRAGLVSRDGATHHGVFDPAFCRPIPGVTVYSPEDFASLERCFDLALAADGPVVVRYPKGGERPARDPDFDNSDVAYLDTGDSPDVAVVTYGRIAEAALSAAKKSENGVRVVRLTKIIPLPCDEIFGLTKDIKRVLFVEEAMRRGGIGEAFAAEAAVRGFAQGRRIEIAAIDGAVPPHGGNDELFELCGISENAILTKIADLRSDET